MAKIHRQIESLKQLRWQLDKKGIDRFHSIGEINAFLNNYETERNAVYIRYRNEVETKIERLRHKTNKNWELLCVLKEEKKKEQEETVKEYQNKILSFKNKGGASVIAKVVSFFGVQYFQIKAKALQQGAAEIIKKACYNLESELIKEHELLGEYTRDKEKHIAERSVADLQKLADIKETLLELRPIIAGAIGEHKVVNEIKKLSDDYILINDFSMAFQPPIYNQKENDRIHSIQIDHLLLSKAGIFILETKNWSKRSIESLNLRSPVEQIRRYSYAMYRYLHSKEFSHRLGLNNHQWGEREIPIRNLIVMINQKPNEQFKYVKVKTVRELNPYLEYFDPVFSDAEFQRITNFFVGGGTS